MKMFPTNIHQLLNYSISIISLIFCFNMLFSMLFNTPLFLYSLPVQNPLPKAKGSMLLIKPVFKGCSSILLLFSLFVTTVNLSLSASRFPLIQMCLGYLEQLVADPFAGQALHRRKVMTFLISHGVCRHNGDL